nr:methyltransferase [Legionella tunisiensis]
MRALVSVGIFKEISPKQFALNDLAEPLCSDSLYTLKDFATFVAHPVHNGAHSALLHTVKTGETGFDYVHGTDSFNYMKTDTEFFKVFNAAMTSISHRDAHVISKAYDFSCFNTLVDVGGGNGFYLQRF